MISVMQIEITSSVQTQDTEESIFDECSLREIVTTRILRRLKKHRLTKLSLLSGSVSQVVFTYEATADTSTQDPKKFADPEADNVDDENQNLGPAFGQSHRAKLQAEARAGNLTEDIDAPAPYRGNKNKGRQRDDARNSAARPMPTASSRDPPRNPNIGHGNRPVLQPKSRYTVPVSNAPSPRVVISTGGESSGTRAPPHSSNGRLTP